MSQEKVDRYKKEKTNRKKIMKKERFMNVLRKTVLSMTALLLVGWLGYSAYQTYEAGKERPVAQVNYDAVNNYMGTLAN